MKGTGLLLERIDRVAYLKALISVAHADLKLQPAELEFLRNQAEAFDVDLEPLLDKPEADLSGICERINLPTRRMIIRDCITLAVVDGEYSDVEREQIGRVAESLGVSSERMAALEGWLERYSAVLEEGQALLESPED